jgi:hypothetical protein
MKHYTKPDGTVWAFEPDGSQDSLITADMTAISDGELAILRTPVLVVPQEVTMRQARLALAGAGLLSAVNAAINSMPEPQKTAALIEWEYSTVVKRSQPLVQSLVPILGLTEAQIDTLFIQATTL